MSPWYIEGESDLTKAQMQYGWIAPSFDPWWDPDEAEAAQQDSKEEEAVHKHESTAQDQQDGLLEGHDHEEQHAAGLDIRRRHNDHLRQKAKVGEQDHAPSSYSSCMVY